MVKKKITVKYNVAERRGMVIKEQACSIQDQCLLLGIHRSGFYYVPKGESAGNLGIMRLIDAYFLAHPHSGVISICAYLCLSEGFLINVKRVRRLMRLMGLMAIYPSRKLSVGNKAHTIYPYLLRGLKIDRVNQVWQTDITYIPMKKGFMYMMAVIDVKSRYILNWSLSNTMDAGWCTTVLKDTIQGNGLPDILNTDQGSQFTASEFVEVSKGHGVQISMDGKGRAIDNIFIERFWRSLKYEHIYLNPATDGLELYQGVKKYVLFYNQERRHHSINFMTPFESYQQKAA